MLRSSLARAACVSGLLLLPAPAAAQISASVGPAPAAKAAAKAPRNALPRDFERYLTAAMRDWKVPGLALAIVHEDSVVVARGFGTRTLGETQPVDEHTLFAIGSATKAFTATLVAMQVDAGKMRWDDPATGYLSGFQLFDPYATRELTVRDLLAHRSGLARGDLVWYASGYDRAEILRRVRFLRPSWSLRSRFGYQNIMYVAAGQAVATAAGSDWDTLLRERIFQPLGMTESSSSVKALAGRANVATPHTLVEDSLLLRVPYHDIDNVGPAGSINSSAADMAKWVRFQLAQGKTPGPSPKTLVSASALAETHQAQTVIPLSPDARQLNPETHLSAYGMGWFLQDYRGRLIVQHGGNIDGMSAIVWLVPEEKLGGVVLTNANGSPMPTITMLRIIDAYLGAPPRDWSAAFRAAQDKARGLAKEAEQKRLAQRVAGTRPSLALEKYAGVYVDSMYGDARVRLQDGRLFMTYGNAFDGELEHWHFDTFRAVWKNRTLGKSWVSFTLDAEGKTKNLDVEGLATFARRPESADTTRRITLAAAAIARFAGTYRSTVPALSIEVRADGDVLKLSVPGQPTYTLLADSPTRFRLTGPPGMPAGFFVEFAPESGAPKQMTLIQPSPRPTLVLERQ